MARIVVLISGRGSNLAAILDRHDADDLGGGRVVAVFSNKAEAPGLAHARRRSIPARVVPSAAFAERDAFDAELSEAIDAFDPDLVVLAGYMRILSAAFVRHYEGRLINIHPSLLPNFRGMDAVGQALRAGATESGCTVHFVTEGVDEGPVIARASVPVRPGDDRAALEARILAAEHALYPRVIAEWCERMRTAG